MDIQDFDCVGCGAKAGQPCDMAVIGTHDRTPFSEPQVMHVRDPANPDHVDTYPVERPDGQGSSVGSFRALLQSLRAMAQARREDGAEGHALVAERAMTALVDLEKHVTRFLEYPGTVVDHPKHGQLSVQHAKVAGGDVALTVQSTPGNYFTVMLSEVVPAGPVADAVRIMVNTMVSKVAADFVHGDEVRAALLKTERPDDAQDCSGCGTTGFCGLCGGTGFVVPHGSDLVPVSLREALEPQSETVHHLQVHDTYRMSGDGHCEPEDTP